MEDWVFLGDSGSDAETVCSVESETGFAMVQLRRSHAKADGGKTQGDHQEECNDDDDDCFDLDLPALAGSVGANGDCFDLDLAASILSLGSVGSDDSGTHGADTDTVGLGAADDGDGDGTVRPERVLCAHCASMDTDRSSYAAGLLNYDDIDTGSSDDELSLSDEDDLHDYTEDNTAPQQRRLTATATWRPPCAPHLYFTQRSRSTSKSTDAAEDNINKNEPVSYPDAAKGDDIVKSSDEGTIVTSDTSYRDGVISDFVRVALTRKDALFLFDNIESELELPQYNLTTSDINAWKAALSKGRAEIAARSRPPFAPHLYFTQRSRSTSKSTDAVEDDINKNETVSYPDAAKGDDIVESSDEDTTMTSDTSYHDGDISDFVRVALTREDALVLFDNIESELELPQYNLSTSDINSWKAALSKGRAEIAARPQPPFAPHLYFPQRSRSTSKSTDAVEDDILKNETVSYPNAAKGDDIVESSDEGTTVTSDTSYRDDDISDFVRVALTREDALVLFDNIESELELPQYNLSTSDINAWKAALSKGREEIAARPRPPFAPHLFFTQPSRST